jgi:hypothetical protein
VQREQLERVESGFSPVPVLKAPYFEREVLGTEMLERLAGAIFAEHDAAAMLHDRVTQELQLDGDRAELRLDLPFVSKGDVTLKKIGLELVVRVDGQSAPSSCPARSPPSAPARPRWSTGRWSSASTPGSRRVPDPLEAMREAERLVREATERAEAIAREGARHVPPRGFDVPGRERAAEAFPDLAALTGLLELGRQSLPRSSRASSRRRSASC